TAVGRAIAPASRTVPTLPQLPVRDSVTLRWEAGASSDLIDEQFFEYRDEVFDTLSRIRVSEPEARYAGGAALALDGRRAAGRGRALLLARQAAVVSAALDRSPVAGNEARVGYSFAVRTFPDSSARDHLEHGWQGHWRRLLSGAGWFGLDTDGERRSTLHEVSSTRDNFWRGHAGAEFESGVLAGPWLRARIEADLLRYDVPDSEVYENENRVRVVVLPGLRPGLGRSFALEPRLEWLRSPQQEAEDYRE